MKVLVDCHGADAGVQVAVEGALDALNERKSLSVVLCGKKQDIDKCLEGKTYDKERLGIKEAGEPITNDDAPALAIRRKKDSSMVLGLRALAAGEADAMVSAGNTGSLLVGTQVIVKLIEGATRATLASVVPTIKDTHTIIVDSGANVDCRPEMLEEFAVMGGKGYSRDKRSARSAQKRRTEFRRKHRGERRYYGRGRRAGRRRLCG